MAWTSIQALVALLPPLMKRRPMNASTAAAAVPRGHVQRRVSGPVLRPEHVVHAPQPQPPPGLLDVVVAVIVVLPAGDEPDDDSDGVRVPRPRREVERRVLRGGQRGEEVPATTGEFGDQAAVALPGGDVEERPALCRHLAGAAASSGMTG